MAAEQRIPREAIDAFRQMKEIECDCVDPALDWVGEHYRHHPCSGSAEWWSLHRIIHRALKLPPDLWPCLQHPNASPPDYSPRSFLGEQYPGGRGVVDARWRPDEQAQALYRMLDAALEDEKGIQIVDTLGGAA
jgi:hypothetical protein